MKKRIVNKILAGILASTLLIGLTGCANGAGTATATEAKTETTAEETAEAGEVIKVRVADMPIYAVAFFGYAEKLGLVDKYSDDGSVVFENYTFESGPAENEAFAAGELDFAIMGNMPATTGVNSGYGDKIIAVAYDSKYPAAIAVPAESDITSIADLKGKTVGTVIGGGYHYYLGAYLSDAGLDISDVDVLNTGSETATSLKAREIDAGSLDVSVARQLENEGEIKIIKEDFIEQPMGLIVASEKFVTENPEVAKKILQIIQETYESIDADRDAFFKYIADVTGSDTTALEETWDLREYRVHAFDDVDFAEEESLYNWMNANDLLANPDNTYDELFLLDIANSL